MGRPLGHVSRGARKRPASLIACARESLTTTFDLVYATMIACVHSPVRCAAGSWRSNRIVARTAKPRWDFTRRR